MVYNRLEAQKAVAILARNRKLAEGSIIIVGAPGAGRRTIVNALLHKYPQLNKVLTSATRKPEFNEQHGVDYLFNTAAEFCRSKIICAYHIAEKKKCRYGIPLTEIDRVLDEQRPALFVTNSEGAETLKIIFGSAVSIVYIKSEEEIRHERLIYRFTHLQPVFKKLLSDDDKEAFIKKFKESNLKKLAIRKAFGAQQVAEIEKPEFAKNIAFTFEVKRSTKLDYSAAEEIMHSLEVLLHKSTAA